METATIDFEFRQAAEEGKVSVEEMLRRLQAAMPLLEKPAEEGAGWFSETYAAAVRHAKGAELDELERLLRSLPAGSSAFDQCFSACVTARIRQRVAQLAAKPVRLEWKPSKQALPKELADAPASFRDAWKLHRTVIAPYLAIVLPPEHADFPRKKVPRLEVDLRRVMGIPEPGAWKHLRVQIWGSWCGTGSEFLYHPRNRALLLSFLADGKLREAAGAALQQMPNLFSVDKEPFDLVAVDLLTTLGLDWEQVMFGSLLPVTSYNSANHRAVVCSGFTESHPWRLLAARGSERAVRQCLDLIRSAKVDPDNAGEFLAVALGPEPAQPDLFSASSDTQIVRSVALPQECRREAAAVFAEYLAPTNTPADLLAAMGKVPFHAVKDLREPLTTLVSHRVHAVATKAHGLLGRAGLANGEEKIAPAAPPMHFRMVLKGKPLSGVKVSLDARAQPTPSGTEKSPTPLDADVTITTNSPPGDGEQTFSRSVAPSQELMTDVNGEIAYSLEECLEPERIAAVQFRIGPPAFFDTDDGSLPGLPRESPKEFEHEWSGPWIVHQVEASAGDERMHEIELQVTDLEVELAAFDAFDPATPIKIMLSRAHPHGLFSPEGGAVRVTEKVGSSAFFRRLQPGKYILAIKAPGAALYDSGEITVGDTAAVHQVKLDPGRNVRGTAVFPNGTKASLGYSSRLFRDGVEVQGHGSVAGEWKDLPFGKYTLRIPSTRNREEEIRKAGLPMNRVAKENRVGAREVKFVIDTSTPATLDLGEVTVPRENR